MMQRKFLYINLPVHLIIFLVYLGVELIYLGYQTYYSFEAFNVSKLLSKKVFPNFICTAIHKDTHFYHIGLR